MYPPFSKQEYISSGSFARVYKVVTKDDNKVYALKEFKNVSDKDGLRKEVDTLRKLQHPHVVRIYDSCFVNKCSMLMEYCPFNLRQAIKEKIAPNRAFQLFCEILEGMNFIHKQNMVHNDLKPENILLDNKYSVKIGDFGLARQCDYAKFGIGSIHGTTLYLPPEALNSPLPMYSSKVDMYSIGIILFEMYVENCSSDLIRMLKSDPEGVRKMFPRENISPIKEIISQLLSKNPEQRPSAGHLIRSFKENGQYPKHQSNERQNHDSQQRSGTNSGNKVSNNHCSKQHGSGHKCSKQHGSGNHSSRCSKKPQQCNEGMALVKLPSQQRSGAISGHHDSGNKVSNNHCSKQHGSGHKCSKQHGSGNPSSRCSKKPQQSNEGMALAKLPNQELIQAPGPSNPSQRSCSCSNCRKSSQRNSNVVKDVCEALVCAAKLMQLNAQQPTPPQPPAPAPPPPQNVKVNFKLPLSTFFNLRRCD